MSTDQELRERAEQLRGQFEQNMRLTADAIVQSRKLTAEHDRRRRVLQVRIARSRDLVRISRQVLTASFLSGGDAQFGVKFLGCRIPHGRSPTSPPKQSWRGAKSYGGGRGGSGTASTPYACMS